MGNLFGRKKVSRVTEHDKAVLQVKQQRDKLKQYQQRIESKLESERLMAKKLLQNNQRERAKLLLKKKRYQEQLLEKTDGQLENLEKLISDLEFSQVEMQVVAGLKAGNDALKKMNDILSIDEIERIMDETKEGIEKQQEITDLLSGALSAEDLEAIEEEYEQLAGLDKRETGRAELDDEEVPELPEVPKEEPALPSKEKKLKTETKEKVKIALEAS